MSDWELNSSGFVPGGKGKIMLSCLINSTRQYFDYLLAWSNNYMPVPNLRFISTIKLVYSGHAI